MLDVADDADDFHDLRVWAQPDCAHGRLGCEEPFGERSADHDARRGLGTILPLERSAGEVKFA